MIVEKIGRSLVSLPDSRLMTQIDQLLTPDYMNVEEINRIVKEEATRSKRREDY